MAFHVLGRTFTQFLVKISILCVGVCVCVGGVWVCVYVVEKADVGMFEGHLLQAIQNFKLKWLVKIISLTTLIKILKF